MHNKFRSHGQFSLSISDNILLFYSKGPWNEEIVDEIEDVARPLIEELSKGKWGVLLIPDGEAIHIPESEEKAITLIQQAKLKGRVATAIVSAGLEARGVIEHYLTSLYTKGGESIAFFDTADDARTWLSQAISDAERDSNC